MTLTLFSISSSNTKLLYVSSESSLFIVNVFQETQDTSRHGNAKFSQICTQKLRQTCKRNL